MKQEPLDAYHSNTDLSWLHIYAKRVVVFELPILLWLFYDLRAWLLFAIPVLPLAALGITGKLQDQLESRRRQLQKGRAWQRKLAELIESGRLTYDQAMAIEPYPDDHQGKRMFERMVDLGHLTELEGAGSIARYFNVPMIDLDSPEPGQEILNDLPVELVRKYRMLLVTGVGEKPRLAMSDPTDVLALDEAKSHGFSAEPIVATRSALERAIEGTYGSESRHVEVTGPATTE